MSELSDVVFSAHGRVHLLGAGGAGVSGLARLLAARGIALSAHDRSRSRFTDALVAAGVPVMLGPSRPEALPPDARLVVRSAAVPDADPQVALARMRGIPVLKYAELVARLAPPERTLCVAGTHGKTTTAWMLYHALDGLARGEGAHRAPGALIGGHSPVRGSNAVPPGDAGWFVLEACEFDRSFLKPRPRAAVITNVEGDHLDYYGSLEAVEEAFSRFADRIHPDGLLVTSADVPERVRASAPCPVWTLGRELAIDLTGERRGRFQFRLRGPGWATPEVALSVPGEFNVTNAALALGLAIGLAERNEDEQQAVQRLARRAVEGLAQFVGTERRFERWGLFGEIELVHDYAHHPTEVRAVLEAARRAYPDCAQHVLFQPHQFSRTERFLAQFVDALRGVDRLVVAPVYGARAEPGRPPAVSSSDLAALCRRAGVDAVAAESLARASERLVEGLPERAAVLILGAGDVDGIRGDLFERLAVRRPAASRAPR
jgi:UDP-N-acetylmuramate--alanine ligase